VSRLAGGGKGATSRRPCSYAATVNVLRNDLQPAPAVNRAICAHSKCLVRRGLYNEVRIKRSVGFGSPAGHCRHQGIAA